MSYERDAGVVAHWLGFMTLLVTAPIREGSVYAMPCTISTQHMTAIMRTMGQGSLDTIGIKTLLGEGLPLAYRVSLVVTDKITNKYHIQRCFRLTLRDFFSGLAAFVSACLLVRYRVALDLSCSLRVLYGGFHGDTWKNNRQAA